MYDVFISYRRKFGFAYAKMLSEMLKQKGINAFVDLDELRSGTFNDKLLTAIETSPAFLLILTPGALDRCVDEGDWLTREILKASESGRNIIPVLCDGFDWPKQWDSRVPDRIKMLSNLNCVVMSDAYVDAMVDKIIEYVKGKNLPVQSEVHTQEENQPANDIDGFFRRYMRDMSEVIGVDFAFHAGSIWHQDIARLDTLSALADSGVKIKVIVNSPEVADSMSKYMRHKLKRYIPFEEAISLWKNVQSLYDNVELRISEVPLLRIYYGFNMKNPDENAARIKFYTHGNSKIDSNFSQNFTADDPCYQLYKSEFDFLWEMSTKTKE